MKNLIINILWIIIHIIMIYIISSKVKFNTIIQSIHYPNTIKSRISYIYTIIIYSIYCIYFIKLILFNKNFSIINFAYSIYIFVIIQNAIVEAIILLIIFILVCFTPLLIHAYRTILFNKTNNIIINKIQYDYVKLYNGSIIILYIIDFILYVLLV